MKNDPIKLIYHSMHKRPMPGCLPLFFIMAALLVIGLICMVRVITPTPLRPRGVGNIYYKNDELTRFQVRQRSALPLRLPAYADPAARVAEAEHELPLHRQALPAEAPPINILDYAPDSAAFNAEQLLALPPAAAEEKEVRP